ncbi:MAG TPA: ATP-dependent Clp protease adaptor ClpS [Bacteroidaceae bacterium]|nr:ATP-dependent Clp protease adaptor ClpS [Bacteroidaceae bacterium]
MDSNFTSRPHKIGSGNSGESHVSRLVLYNDDINSFDHVMESLIEVCDHSLLQAEQCAMIAHYKGKCEVRTGERKALKGLRHRLISRGLKVTVE